MPGCYRGGDAGEIVMDRSTAGLQREDTVTWGFVLAAAAPVLCGSELRVPFVSRQRRVSDRGCRLLEPLPSQYRIEFSPWRDGADHRWACAALGWALTGDGSYHLTAGDQSRGHYYVSDPARGSGRHPDFRVLAISAPALAGLCFCMWRCSRQRQPEGAHYLADVLAGIAVAAGSWAVAKRLIPPVCCSARKFGWRRAMRREYSASHCSVWR